MNMFHHFHGHRSSGVIPDSSLWSCNVGLSLSFAGASSGKDACQNISEIVTGHRVSFIGIYDGTAGSMMAKYLCQNLFANLKGIVAASVPRVMSEAALTAAFRMTDEAYLEIARQSPIPEHLDASHVHRDFATSTGSCCLVGVIWQNRLYLGNVGDSRAVMGSYGLAGNVDLIQPLTRDDNVKNTVALAEQRDSHDDPDSIIAACKTMAIVRRSQLTKGMGFAYLKSPDCAMDYHHLYKLEQPIHYPALSAEPITSVRQIEYGRRFVIFASAGLWNILSNVEAVEFVAKEAYEQSANESRSEIAGRLVVRALERAASVTGMTYEQLKTVPKNLRHLTHADITVAIIFFDRPEGLLGPGEPERVAYGGYYEGISSRTYLAPDLSPFVVEGNEEAQD